MKRPALLRITRRRSLRWCWARAMSRFDGGESLLYAAGVSACVLAATEVIVRFDPVYRYGLVIIALLGFARGLVVWEKRRTLRVEEAHQRQRRLHLPSHVDDLLDTTAIQQARTSVPSYDARIEAIRTVVLDACKEHLEARRGPRQDAQHWNGALATHILPKERLRVVFWAPFGPGQRLMRFQRTIDDDRVRVAIDAHLRDLARHQRSLMAMALQDHIWRDHQPLYTAHQRLHLRRKTTTPPPHDDALQRLIIAP